ncbi:nuclear transport factor 2 family protein [Spongiimicrobium salis]|uniref:nuclear transport factor 2 family protein n=1 Tax=Spongiimicrobium salis TaxID=1667022 RepID=UPI00374DA313
MKHMLIIVISLMGIIGNAQTEEQLVQNTVTTFFDAFHAQDSTQLKTMMSEDMVLQTIGRNKEGKPAVIHEDYHKFLASIVSIPETTKFEERLTSFDIKVDGPMANAWVGYEFYVNENFSHCGVNSFQLFKDEGKWKIIYLVDTRRKKGCKS